ncbi:hypothetical protein HXX76_000671 [Chlamydomonas incerta]|uniref:Uncharacterized protein n=1 Tax=Chlamydomonas incerta TaxID=51695 RepID=A0A835WFC3_CHLIN|nr:hypothetical protein HXX76_000671 [Chlamydomonas incerta]|eukprot:KAG2446070.1 hypothetical protein HXX76_000671 [Chlamydomonas incerta]
MMCEELSKEVDELRTELTSWRARQQELRSEHSQFVSRLALHGVQVTEAPVPEVLAVPDVAPAALRPRKTAADEDGEEESDSVGDDAELLAEVGGGSEPAGADEDMMMETEGAEGDDGGGDADRDMVAAEALAFKTEPCSSPPAPVAPSPLPVHQPPSQPYPQPPAQQSQQSAQGQQHAFHGTSEHLQRQPLQDAQQRRNSGGSAGAAGASCAAGGAQHHAHGASCGATASGVAGVRLEPCGVAGSRHGGQLTTFGSSSVAGAGPVAGATYASGSGGYGLSPQEPHAASPLSGAPALAAASGPSAVAMAGTGTAPTPPGSSTGEGSGGGSVVQPVQGAHPVGVAMYPDPPSYFCTVAQQASAALQQLHQQPQQPQQSLQQSALHQRPGSHHHPQLASCPSGLQQPPHVARQLQPHSSQPLLLASSGNSADLQGFASFPPGAGSSFGGGGSSVGRSGIAAAAAMAAATALASGRIGPAELKRVASVPSGGEGAPPKHQLHPPGLRSSGSGGAGSGLLGHSPTRRPELTSDGFGSASPHGGAAQQSYDAGFHQPVHPKQISCGGAVSFGAANVGVLSSGGGGGLAAAAALLEPHQHLHGLASVPWGGFGRAAGSGPAGGSCSLHLQHHPHSFANHHHHHNLVPTAAAGALSAAAAVAEAAAPPVLSSAHKAFAGQGVPYAHGQQQQQLQQASGPGLQPLLLPTNPEDPDAALWSDLCGPFSDLHHRVPGSGGVATGAAGGSGAPMQLDVMGDSVGGFDFGCSRRGSVDSLGSLGRGSAGGSGSGRGDGEEQVRNASAAQDAAAPGPAAVASAAIVGVAIGAAGAGADAPVAVGVVRRTVSGDSADSGRDSKRSGSSDSGRSLTYVQLTEGLHGTSNAMAAPAAGSRLNMDAGGLPNDDLSAYQDGDGGLLLDGWDLGL